MGGTTRKLGAKRTLQIFALPLGLFRATFTFLSPCIPIERSRHVAISQEIRREREDVVILNFEWTLGA